MCTEPLCLRQCLASNEGSEHRRTVEANKTQAEYRQEVLNERERKWRAKALHGQYLKDTEDKINKAKTNGNGSQMEK